MTIEDKVTRTKVSNTLIKWAKGDVTAQQCYSPHGKRTYGYGHWGHEYGWTLFVRKNDTLLATKSLPKQVYTSYIKAIIAAIASKPVKCPYCNRLSYFCGKEYKEGRLQTLYLFECERCHRPKYGDADYTTYGDNHHFTGAAPFEIQARYYPDGVFYKEEQKI